MAKLLVRGEWYDELASQALYENEFEDIFIDHAEILYPEYYTIRFKMRVRSDLDARHADLALIERSLREWWVVEVELGHHDFHSHVLPQVATLSAANYHTKGVLNCLQSALPNVAPAALTDLLKGKQPRVLVVTNTPCPHWSADLAPYDALVTTLELYRSHRNKLIVRVDGNYPEGPAHAISECHLDDMLARVLVVESPAGLGVPNAERVIVRCNDGITEWERFDAGHAVYLNPLHNHPLVQGVKYQLIRAGDGMLEIHPMKSSKRK